MDRSRITEWLNTAHIQPAVGVTFLVTLLVYLQGGSLSTTILVAFAVLSGQFSIGLSNNYFDKRNDAKSLRTDKAIVNKTIPARTVLLVAVFFLCVSVLASLAIDIRSGLYHLAAVAIAWSYNINLKNTPLSIVCYMLAFAVIPTFVAEVTNSQNYILTTIAFALLGGVIHFADALKDYEYDKRAGINGFPNSFSLQTSKFIHMVFGISCIVFFALSL